MKSYFGLAATEYYKIHNAKCAYKMCRLMNNDLFQRASFVFQIVAISTNKSLQSGICQRRGHPDRRLHDCLSAKKASRCGRRRRCFRTSPSAASECTSCIQSRRVAFGRRPNGFLGLSFNHLGLLYSQRSYWIRRSQASLR